jgi:hemerythrin-like metal-binding protein
MAPIAWMDVLETGVAELDADHRSLIAECNSLTELMDRGGRWDAVVESVRRLALNCTQHFREEEALLERTDFPRRDRHAAQHREIERRFNELVAFLCGVDGSDPEHRNAARAVRNTLVDILFRHDLDYKSHLQHVTGR